MAAATKTQDPQRDRDRVIVRELCNLSNECTRVNLVVLVPGLLAKPTGMEHTLLVLEKLAKEANQAQTGAVTRTLIYRSKVNFGEKSKDGLVVCGQRLAKEINQLTHYTTVNALKESFVVTLSMLGNSFGGVIARAALADIHWTLTSTSQADKQQTIPVIPKLFSTTMTPHLGSKDSMHAHLSKPVLSALTTFLVKSLGRTGKDLMRQTNDIEILAKDPKYLQPLARFQKRIAFSNSYRTDFRVATGTALFLSPDSQSLHQTIPMDDFPFAIHALKTQVVTTPSNHNHKHNNDSSSWMKDHCENLDALGWTKVFCDIRSELPKVNMPLSATTSGRKHKKKNTKAYPGDDATDLGTTATDSWKSANAEQPDDTTTTCFWTSAQLCQKYCQDEPSTQGTWYMPVGHEVLMANSATAPEEHYSMKGMPFVKEYCARTMQDVLNSLES